MILASPAGQQATKQAVQGIANAVDNLGHSVQSDTQSTSAPTTAVPAVPTIKVECKENVKEDDKDPCKDLRKQIDDVIEELDTRWKQYKEDAGSLSATKPKTPHPRYGKRYRGGERHYYEGKQQRLRNLEEEWNKNGCGPDLPGVWEWLTKQLPGGSENPYDKFPPQ
jgi:hypothetical protein